MSLLNDDIGGCRLPDDDPLAELVRISEEMDLYDIELNGYAELADDFPWDLAYELPIERLRRHSL